MKFNLRRYLSALLLGGFTLGVGARLRGEDSSFLRRMFVLPEGSEYGGGPFQLVNQVDSTQPSDTQPFDTQPFDTQPFDTQPFETQPFDPGPIDAGARGSPFQEEEALREALLRRISPAEVIGTGESQIDPGSTLGELLQDSDSVQSVGGQRRSQTAFDSRVRGYHFGQIYSQADGEYYLPARLDLDSMLSKIDPSLVKSVTVIPGPYALRYGPGFAFIDVITFDTPRAPCGCTFDWGNRFATGVYANGGQVYARDTYWGGGKNYGFIMNYGIRTGSDYRAGNGQRIPSSYNNQSALAQLGFDLPNDGKVEFRYNRLDMRDTEYWLEFFDLNFLNTDSFNVNYRTEDPSTGTQTLAQVWYNETRYNGNNLNSGKTEVRTRVVNGLNNDFELTPGTPSSSFVFTDFRGFVTGDLTSTGARLVKTYGEEAWVLLRYGADFRYVTQSTQERYSINDRFQLLNPDEENFSTNQPHSSMTDPGLFTELTFPWFSFLRTTWGGRVDWVNTHPRASEYDNTPLLDGVTNVDLSQNDVLLATYLTGDAELSEEWKVRVGAGYAERVPDLVNRYSDGVFLGIIQNGFSKVAGFPGLRKERALQADASLIADYGWALGRATYFHSWINDYNTYAAYAIDPPTGAQILLAQNTSLATLNGFEVYLQAEADEYTTPFVALQYVEGFDHEIHRPLPGIYPLESRLGVRWADPAPASIWGLEWGFRLVARQNRVGMLRDNLVGNLSVRAVESPTAGFVTSYLNGYYNLTPRLHLVGGIDNLFDTTYIEHLDLRLLGPAQSPGGVTRALAPGFTAYAGMEWEM